MSYKVIDKKGVGYSDARGFRIIIGKDGNIDQKLIDDKLFSEESIVRLISKGRVIDTEAKPEPKDEPKPGDQDDEDEDGTEDEPDAPDEPKPGEQHYMPPEDEEEVVSPDDKKMKPGKKKAGKKGAKKS